jgi:hypothetical protein
MVGELHSPSAGAGQQPPHRQLQHQRLVQHSVSVLLHQLLLLLAALAALLLLLVGSASALHPLLLLAASALAHLP